MPSLELAFADGEDPAADATAGLHAGLLLNEVLEACENMKMGVPSRFAARKVFLG
jgi:hypothetical protein